MMSLAEWWARNRAGSEQPSTLAGRVTELPGSMFVAIEADGMLTLMDHDTYDYQHATEMLPDPAQRDLDELTITRVRALSGGMFRGQAVSSAVLLDTSAPDAIAMLRRCCLIVEGPGAGHCACLGGPTLELFAGTKHVVTIGLHHGFAIRWARWRDDARLRDSDALTTWLTDHGVHPTLLDLLFHNPLPLTGGQVDGWGTNVLSRIEQRILVAEIRYEQGQIDAALADCDTLLMEYPNNARAHALRGEVRQRRGELASSVADYTAAIERGYRTARIFFSRAVALDGLGEGIAALGDCAEALALDPDHANAYNSRGIIQMKLGRRQEGLADFAKAIDLAPDWELPYLNRAAFAHMNSDLAAAIADYGRAIKLIEARSSHADRPLLANVYRSRSKVHDEAGDERGADADRREAVRLDPEIGSQ
jgi:Tfp pilus assembly protein PilF